MDAKERSALVGRCLFLSGALIAAVVAARCGGGSGCGPTGICPTPTATPSPTPVSCVSAPPPMTGFTANPSTITYGDTFNLSWTAPCGFVTLRQKDGAHFALAQATNGTYELRLNANGYPSGPGSTTYEATNGDTAQRLFTTVTVNPKATPTPAGPPTISLSGADSCYPVRTLPPGCSVQVTATASNYDSIAWSGCCTGSSGVTGTCHVANLSAATCTATAIGAGGSAQASKQVTGVNAAPVLASKSRSPNGASCSDTTVTFEFWFNDEDGVAQCRGLNVWNFCSNGGVECPVAGSPKMVRVTANMDPPPHDSGLCYVEFVARDEWGADSVKVGHNAGVSTCP